MAIAYVGVGSNLGDRLHWCRLALREVTRLPHTALLQRSALYESEPWGRADQPWFLNGVLRIETGLSPQELLDGLLRIEDRCGRCRLERWGPRNLDLDLLLYDQVVLDGPRLCLPHPRLHLRRFVLEPLVELDPGLRHPVLGCTVEELLAALPAGPRVRRLEWSIASTSW